MNNWLNRTENLIGTAAVNRIKNSKIVIFGIGGVGSFVVEGLVRSGVENIILVDKDIVDETNINRQLIADTTTLGLNKVEVAKERILKINPSANVEIFKEFVNQDNVSNFINSNSSYVVDCIDTVSSKLAIIEKCNELNVPVISCMGTGNKLDPTKFEISDIKKTSVCPLAKVMRKELKKRNITNLKVLYSKEEPIKISSNTPASIAFVPSVAGLIIAGEVVRDLVKWSDFT